MTEQSDLFLTEFELETMTGYKVPRKQREWLTHYHIPFYVSARGRPVVVRKLIEQLNSIIENNKEPNFGAI